MGLLALSRHDFASAIQWLDPVRATGTGIVVANRKWLRCMYGRRPARYPRWPRAVIALQTATNTLLMFASNTSREVGLVR
jgi:hypothetical protein